MNNLKATVIIPTRNRSDVLIDCLNSLSQQSLPKEEFEVLVVDNGSTDETKAVAKNFSNCLQLHYHFAPEPGLHIGRHVGLKEALSEILIYGDDDIKPSPIWVESIVDNFSDPKVALVGGNNHPNFESAPPDWLNCLWQMPVYKGKALPSLSILDFGEGVFEIDPLYVWGCNFSIRRKVLEDAKGFHPDGVPESQILYRGDGETHVSNYVRNHDLKTVFDSKASVKHLVSTNRMTEKYFKKRSYSQGISDSYTHMRNGETRNALWLHDFKHVFRNSIKGLINELRFRHNPTLKKIKKIQILQNHSYWKGYFFHQSECKRSPELYNWVMKDNYL